MKYIGFFFRLLWFLVRCSWYAFVIITPILGVWVSSSLSIYLNGPFWAACLMGTFLFPISPLLWELRALRKTRIKQEENRTTKKNPYFRFWDRMIIRTLVINTLFLSALLSTFPEKAFAALSINGDWVLEHKEGPNIEKIRTVLFHGAESLEWLYDISHENPYRNSYRKDHDSNHPLYLQRTLKKAKVGTDAIWPMKETMHPIVEEIPASANKSYVAVAKYIARNVSDPFQRVKALHDYVADRIDYDYASLDDGSYGTKQDPKLVWENKFGVCAGYAKLLVAMGQITGDKIIYVTGDVRASDGNMMPDGHAWNAAQINGSWYLIDATWNAGSFRSDPTKRDYKTTYFFSDPEAFGLDHCPDNSVLQLREQPLSRSAFLRQPLLKPSFRKFGLKLISPTRPHLSLSKPEISIRIQNKQKSSLLASLHLKEGDSYTNCSMQGDVDVTILCTIPKSGSYFVRIFARSNTENSYDHVAEISLNY